MVLVRELVPENTNQPQAAAPPAATTIPAAAAAAGPGHRAGGYHLHGIAPAVQHPNVLRVLLLALVAVRVP